jgi:hypothetical protein
MATLLEFMNKFFQSSLFSSKLFPIVALISIWALMMVGVGYDFGVEGDDIFMVSPVLNQVPLGELSSMSYFSIASSRHYLVITLILLFKLMGESTVAMEWVFLVAWLFNGVLIYVLLSRFFNAWSSLLSATFFLVYAGKYEVVPVLAGGVYQFVIAIFLFILLIATSSKLPWILKALTISLLFWISIHWYELLIPMAPLLPLLYWGLVKKGAVKRGALGWAFSFFPVFIVIFHLYVLSTSANPIWGRSGKKSLLEVIFKIPHVFFANYQSLFLEHHWRQLINAYESYLQALRLGDYGLFALTTLALVFCLGLIGALAIKAAFTKSANLNITQDITGPFYTKSLVFVAIYILLVAHLVSWPVMINDASAPPRLTYIPSLAIAILAAWGMALRVQMRVVVAIFFTFITAIEGFALKTILLQYGTTATYDTNIRNQLKGFGFKPNIGDTIFISLPENGLIHHLWREAPAKFTSGRAQTLIMLDNDNVIYTKESEGKMLHEMILYENSIRAQNSVIEREASKSILRILDGDQTIRPFFLTQENQLCLVDRIVVKNVAGNEIASKSVPLSNYDSIPCKHELVIISQTEKIKNK